MKDTAHHMSENITKTKNKTKAHCIVYLRRGCYFVTCACIWVRNYDLSDTQNTQKEKKLTTFYELSYTSNIYVSDVFCETKKPTAYRHIIDGPCCILFTQQSTES